MLREPLCNTNIARNILSIGRDQGVAGYNAYRQWCGLDTFTSFDQLKSVMDLYSCETLAGLYDDIDDVDLFSAGLLERPLEGAKVGPTFACIIGRQFHLLRAADRFWFESSQGPHAFTADQLDSIKQVTLARLLCANSDHVYSIQEQAMRLPHAIHNPIVGCSQLADVDLSLWYEPQVAAQVATLRAPPVQSDVDDDW